MTSPVSSPATPTTSWLHGLEDLVGPTAAAVAAAMPSAQPLTAGPPQTPGDLDVSGWAAAAVASVASGPGASVAILVRSDLTSALAAAPSGGLEVGAALQPALDAGATALGSTAGAGQTATGERLAELVAAATVACPLLADGQAGAVLLLTVPGGPATPGVTQLPPAGPRRNESVNGMRGVELLHGVAMEVTVELGRTQLSVRELLALSPGDVLELDRAAGSPADLLVNGRLIARGEVVVVDENFALRVTEIVAQSRAS